MASALSAKPKIHPHSLPPRQRAKEQSSPQFHEEGHAEQSASPPSPTSPASPARGANELQEGMEGLAVEANDFEHLLDSDEMSEFTDDERYENGAKQCGEKLRFKLSQRGADMRKRSRR